ncbi:1-phosphofructokinase [Methylobacterium organophilum]|uniref:Phosphofructokinase n=1 Tax=Methylobacterium organophilum TaxID=410 RepID=A0ABQ4T4F5_METOR|nr:1-phosphofructokinase [Methylobacterium organophilum]GJE25517.1 Tagatose-6-phosphate kinase [Methylobacterium organophilum]
MSAVVTVTLNPAIDQTVTLDALKPGGVHRARAVWADAGGKGVNVACCLADWGLPVVATGVLGQGNAAPFEQLLAAKGIDDRFVWIPGETRTNLKILDAATGETTDVNLPGLDVGASTFETVRAVLGDLAGDGCLVVLAGSLPRALPPDVYARLGRELKARGARVVLDASGPPLAAALAAGPEALPYAIKPNRHELEEWAGRSLTDPSQLLEAAQRLQGSGIPLVVVSLGAEGALFVAAEGALRALPPPTRVSSTVGAGDALVAGLVAGLHDGLALPDLARRALAFAAGKLSRTGANLPGRDAVEALARDIRVEWQG